MANFAEASLSYILHAEKELPWRRMRSMRILAVSENYQTSADGCWNGGRGCVRGDRESVYALQGMHKLHIAHCTEERGKKCPHSVHVHHIQ